METYDVIVVGGGSTGENVAGTTQAGGLRTALIESELVGGECSYWACMPSKALLRPLEASAAARRVPAVAAALTAGIDVGQALRSRDALASHWDDHGQVRWVEGEGVTLVRGHGRLAGPRRVDVAREDGEIVQLAAAAAVVLATGTRAAMPPIPGLAEARPWDNRDATAAKDVPGRLLVLGGGAVGCELAQAWRSLGAEEVTLLEALPRLLPTEEPFAGEAVAESLAGQGVDVRTGAEVVEVRRPADGAPVTVVLGGGDERSGDELLVATGRRPNTADVGLNSVGLEPGKPVVVDDQLRATGVDGGWLYAAGDCTGRALLTHMGKYQARLCGAAILGEDVRAFADRVAVPRVVFTDPQVASVGRTQEQARAAGLDVRVVQVGIGSVAGAALLGEGISGGAQLVVDAERDVVVGATFVGPGVGELLHAATIAIVGEVPVGRLWHAVPAFPTLSELWLRLLEALAA